MYFERKIVFNLKKIIMGNLFDSLKNYFENTPQDILENDWKEIEYLNEIGPDVIEYAEYVKTYFETDVSYSNVKNELETHKFGLSECLDNNRISAEAPYYFAA